MLVIVVLLLTSQQAQVSVARVGKFLRNEDLSDDNVHRNPHSCKYTGACVERDLSDKTTMPASELILFGASDSIV